MKHCIMAIFSVGDGSFCQTLRFCCSSEILFIYFFFQEQSEFKSSAASSLCQMRRDVRLDQPAELQPSVLGAALFSV